MADLLGGKPLGLPYDVMTEQARLARKRKLTEALRARSMQDYSPTVNTGKYLLPNFADPISQYMDAKRAADEEKKLDEQEKTVAADVNARTGPAMQDLIKSLSGGMTPQAPMRGAPGEQEAPTPVPDQYTPPDVIGGVGRAMASGLPGVKDMASEFLRGMFKQKGEGGGPVLEKFLTASHDLDPAARQQMWKGISGQDLPVDVFRPKAEAHVAGDVVATTRGGKLEGAPQPLQTYSKPAVDPNVNLPMQTSDVTGKATAFTGGDVTVPTALAKNIGDEAAKTLGTGYKEANDSIQGLKSISQARMQMANLDPAKMGFGAEFRMEVSKAIQMLSDGKVVPKDLSNLEALNSTLGNLVIDKIRILAPVTKEDVATMRSIAGSITNTRDGLEKILAIAEKRMADNITKHNTFVQGLMRQPGGQPASIYYIGDPNGAAEIARIEPPGPGTTPFQQLTPEQHQAYEAELEALRKKLGIKR